MCGLPWELCFLFVLMWKFVTHSEVDIILYATNLKSIFFLCAKIVETLSLVRLILLLVNDVFWIIIILYWFRLWTLLQSYFISICRSYISSSLFYHISITVTHGSCIWFHEGVFFYSWSIIFVVRWLADCLICTVYLV